MQKVKYFIFISFFIVVSAVSCSGGSTKTGFYTDLKFFPDTNNVDSGKDIAKDNGTSIDGLQGLDGIGKTDSEVVKSDIKNVSIEIRDASEISDVNIKEIISDDGNLVDAKDINTTEAFIETVQGCPGKAGCSCKEDSDCDSGFCIETDKGFECADFCDQNEKCPTSYHCRGIAGSNNEISKICIYDFPRICLPCLQDEDCNAEHSSGDAKCVAWVPVIDDQRGESDEFRTGYGKEGAFCATACKDDSDCPTGYECRQVITTTQSKDRQCVLITGTCGSLTRQ